MTILNNASTFSDRIPKGAVVDTTVEVCPVCHLGDDYGDENNLSIA